MLWTVSIVDWSFTCQIIVGLRAGEVNFYESVCNIILDLFSVVLINVWKLIYLS